MLKPVAGHTGIILLHLGSCVPFMRLNHTCFVDYDDDDDHHHRHLSSLFFMQNILTLIIASN